MVVLGPLNIIAAAAEWRWFEEWPSNRWLYNAFGREWAKRIHMALGVLIVVLGGVLFVQAVDAQAVAAAATAVRM